MRCHPPSGSSRVQRVTSQQQDHVRLEQRDLLIEEGAARLHLERLGVAVARRPALDDVGDVDVATVEPDRLEQRRQQAPGGADEGFALAVLVLAGRLADGHDACGHRSVPGNGLDAREMQRARGALANPPVELEDLFGRRHHWRSSSAPPDGVVAARGVAREPIIAREHRLRNLDGVGRRTLAKVVDAEEQCDARSPVEVSTDAPHLHVIGAGDGSRHRIGAGPPDRQRQGCRGDSRSSARTLRAVVEQVGVLIWVI